MVLVSRWNARETLVDSLFSGSTNVRGGTTTTEHTGTDVGFGVRASGGLTDTLHVYAQVDRTRFSGAFAADNDAHWPVDLTVTEIKAGLLLRFSWIH